MNNSLYLAMFLHITLTALLYVILTIFRAPKIWNLGVRKDGSNPFAEIEKRTSANLSNQFEWPLFFHIVCLILLLNESLFSDVYLWLAWIFILGRVLHSAVHIFTSNIRLRGIVFTINFLAVFGMWLLLAINYIK